MTRHCNRQLVQLVPVLGIAPPLVVGRTRNCHFTHRAERTAAEDRYLNDSAVFLKVKVHTEDAVRVTNTHTHTKKHTRARSVSSFVDQLAAAANAG